jgi:hypothetical protein
MPPTQTNNDTNIKISIYQHINENATVISFCVVKGPEDDQQLVETMVPCNLMIQQQYK